METKSHYKMFKSGKLWMTALVTATVLGATQIAHASDGSTQPSQHGADQQTMTVEVPTQQDLQNQAVNLDLHQTAGQPAKQPSVVAAQLSANKTAATPAKNYPQTTIDKANSTITVTNPSNYPTKAASLVGKNAQNQPYYIYQIVNLNNTTINGRQARMILAVDPVNPQGTTYAYVTDDRYSRAYQTVIIASGAYKDISVSATGAALVNPTRNQIFRVSNTAPFTLNFNGKQINVPASLSIKSVGGGVKGVSPVYGLGNQNNIVYSDKVDITPEDNAPAIEYIYKDQNGNYIQNASFLPADVPVHGLTGQEFTITNVENYKQVLQGHYLTNEFGDLSNTPNGLDYLGHISQFQLGKYYEKTLYNWDRSVSQTLIYELIDPQGTMNISLLRPNYPNETLTVPVNEFKVFSNGTLARNPYVPADNSVQLIYADLGHIIPIDENGNVISDQQPIYNNDQTDAHKAAPTASPDLTAQGWVLQNPSDAMIDPVHPGEDTKVVYVRVVTTTENVEVTQTVKYQYADGITEGRPTLPTDNVQTAQFTHTVVMNPITGQKISETWTPAQQFSAVVSPEVPGFFADQAQVGGNDQVTHLTPNMTYIVKYLAPSETTETEQVHQTVKYVYADGITAGRPALPENNVQTLTFIRTIKKDPNGNVISDVWTPAHANFKLVDTPEVTGFIPDKYQAGSTNQVNPYTADTEYVVKFAAPIEVTNPKVLTQTIHYQYADGLTEGRPVLPVDNVQTINFTQHIWINPFTGSEYRFEWEPDHGQFTIVDSPAIAGFYADHAQAGSDSIMLPNDQDTYYVVNYAAPITDQVEQRRVTQTVTYAYADGTTAGRPTLPQTDVQELVFNRTQVRNPYTNEVISDTWSPAQQFTIVKTPAISGFYYDLAQAGSDEPVTHESADTSYQVLYFAPNELTETKQVTQTIHYVYADGVTEGRPALPQTNQQTLTFTRTNHVNPNDPNDIILGQWTPASDHFTIVKTPSVNGFYYDLPQAGSDAAVTGDSADTVYTVKYAPARTITDQKTVTQTIKYVYADGVTDGRPALPTDNVQQLTFTHTIVMNPFTGEMLSDTWTPAQRFQTVVSPTITGFQPNIEVVDGQQVTYLSADLNHLVEYHQVLIPDEPTPDQPIPDQPHPGEPTPDQPKPDKPVGEAPQQPGTPTKRPVANQPHQQRLPQTGNADQSAITGLALLGVAVSLLGFGKRKQF